jgi:hypothetical protein
MHRTLPDGLYSILFVSPGCPHCAPARRKFNRLHQGLAGIKHLLVDATEEVSFAKLCSVSRTPGVRLVSVEDGKYRVRFPLESLEEDAFSKIPSEYLENLRSLEKGD